ncbi:MAG: hypothetical protein PVSMB8_14000 [Vulcanimicrobiaceae bacterium]
MPISRGSKTTAARAPASERSRHIRNDAIREDAIALVARIRIALPFRPACAADLRAVGHALARLRAAGLREDDDAVAQLRDFEQTLEILVPPPQRD